MSAIAMADQMIRAGEIEVAVAGGMESMTNAPYVLPKGREGSRLGDAELIDSMIHDGLWSSFLDHHMGEGTDEVNAELGLTREEQDAWAARSHQRAHAAWTSGRLTDEVVPVEVSTGKGASDHRGSRRRDPARFDTGEPRRAEARVPIGRHDHGGERFPDLRRGMRGRRDEHREGP